MEGESINLNITTTIKCIRLFFPRVTQTNLPNSHYQVKDTQLIAPANIYFPSLTHNPKAKIAANINFVSLTPDPTAHSSGSNLSPPPLILSVPRVARPDPARESTLRAGGKS
jgi:hypothetical protein